jgi:D-3-phosphoglycerate dehydrogenase
MYKVKTLNEIASEGLSRLDEGLQLSQDEAVDAYVMRSYHLHDQVLPSSLLAIARAGVGVNNIPVDLCSERGIVVFNTPGANANGVKEMVLTALLLSSRDVLGGIEFAKNLKEDIVNQVEKGKSQFVGPELQGKTLGVIGLGSVGVLIANAASALGMRVLGYDPYISIANAWGLSPQVRRANSYDEVFQAADYLTLHVPLLESTEHLLNGKTIKKLKKNVRVLNFARAELVDDVAMIEALKKNHVYRYVTDFPNEQLKDVENVIAIPHLGASTPESEINCAVMAVDEINEYLKYGSIINSINFPTCSLGALSSDARITLLHKNIPNMVGQITTELGLHSINIAGMQNMSKKEWAYTVLEIEGEISEDVIDHLRTIEGVVRVRKILAKQS